MHRELWSWTNRLVEVRVASQWRQPRPPCLPTPASPSLMARESC